MNISTAPIGYYRFEFKVTNPIFLPEYAGSALRGAFGRALRKIACMTKQADCKQCPLYQSCVYTNIFETPAPSDHILQKFSQIPNSYIIEPPLDWERVTYQMGETFVFHLVLFGKLNQQLPIITFAFKRAFEYQVSGGTAELQDVAAFDHAQQQFQSIFQHNHFLPYDYQLLIPNELPANLTLQFLTPLRLQKDGKPLRETQLTLERLLISLLKRFALLNEFHAEKLPLEFESLISSIAQICDEKQLQWLDWTRYSSRQKQRMTLGGVIGQWQLNNVPEQWRTLLYIGQWLHCGKNATFGLGKYQITNL